MDNKAIMVYLHWSYVSLASCMKYDLLSENGLMKQCHVIGRAECCPCIGHSSYLGKSDWENCVCALHISPDRTRPARGAWTKSRLNTEWTQRTPCFLCGTYQPLLIPVQFLHTRKIWYFITMVGVPCLIYV